MIEIAYGHPATYLSYYDKQFTQPRKQYNIQQNQLYLYKDHHNDDTVRQRANMSRYFTQNNSVRVKNTNFNKPAITNLNDYYLSIRPELDEDDINGAPMKQEYYRNDNIIYGKDSQNRFKYMKNSERKNIMVRNGNGRVVLN